MEKDQHFVKGSPGQFRAEGSTWDTYKCPHCGRMFEKTESNSDTCPVCGYTCSPEKCELLESSREEF